MARSDKVAFRREFRVSSAGYVGDELGMFVGDILSLHIEVVDSARSSFLLEGRVGRQGSWETLKTAGKEDKKFEKVDVSAYEYIRLYVSSVEEDTEVIIFGYDKPVTSKDSVTHVSLSEDNMLELKHQTLKLDKLVELMQQQNEYLRYILGDDYE